MVACATVHQQCFRYCYHNGKNTSGVYDPVHSSRDVPHTPTVRSAGKPSTHFGYADRIMFQPEHLFYHNFSHDNQYEQVHFPNLVFSHQVTVPINQSGPVVIEASLLASVMVEQPIIQAAISTVETFNGAKSKFEALVASVENAAQISKQAILCITFSEMIGPLLTSAHRLRDHLPYMIKRDLKSDPAKQ